VVDTKPTKNSGKIQAIYKNVSNS